MADTMPPSGAGAPDGAFLVLQSTSDRERLIAQALTGNATELAHPQSLEEVERLVSRAAPDVLVLDYAFEQWPTLCRTLKSGAHRSLPIVVVDWENGGEAAAVSALEAGADEYIGTPARARELRARLYNQLRHKRRTDTLKRVRAERDSLRFDATLDALTTVLTRRALDRELEKLEYEPSELSLIFLDVDHFKAVNDGFGHRTGDRVLAALGRLLRDHLRPSDIVGRYGGEEFVVVLRDAGVDAARRVAERIRQSLAAASISGLRGRVTLSAGVAARAPGETMAGLIVRADIGLYAAKSGGRNRVHVAPEVANMHDSLPPAPPDTLVRPLPRTAELELGHSAAE
jgi:two-component system cell cycle response regulator